MPHQPEVDAAPARIESAGGALLVRVPDAAALRSGAYPWLEHRTSLTNGVWTVILPSRFRLEGEDLVADLPAELGAEPQGFLRIRYVEVP